MLRNRFLAAAGAVAVFATACGGGGGTTLDVESDPKAALSTAFDQLAGSEGIEAVFRLDADADTLLALAADSGDELDRETAELLTSSSLRIRGSGTTPENSEFEFALVLDGEEAVEIRGMGDDLYVRADVRGLIERFDTTGSGLADLEQGIAGMQASGMDFVGPAVEGEWIHISGVKQVLEMVSGFTGAPAQPDEDEVTALRSKIQGIMSAFITEDVEVDYVGSEDAGERVRMTATGAELLDLGDEVFAAMGPLMAAYSGGQDPSAALDELRAEAGPEAGKFTLPIDVWIDGDKVSRVGFDMIAFAGLNKDLLGEDGEVPAGVGELALIIDLAEFTGGVDAPGDAVEVNLFELFGQLGQLGGGLAG